MTLKFNELQQRLKEAKEKKVVFSFGRMNPPTIGHEKLVNKIKSEAKTRGADARLYLSHTSNKEKDPLTYNSKAKYAKKAFGIFVKSRARTIIEVAKELEADGYTDIVLVFGEDRDAEMVNLIKKYNGKEFNFNSIDSVSAGKRDPNAKGVEGISGTKLRELAKTGQLDTFKKALASKLSDREKTAIYNEIRKVYSISDSAIFDRDELREAYLVGELFNVGDIVYDMNENKEYEIVEQGTNFLYCKGADGNVHTKWLSDLTEKKSAKDDDTEVRQDKDIADKDGTQPAKYFAGLKSKSTKSARDAHFKKGAEKSDDDPSAYKPAPGDATAKTKPSTHTKKFKAMFGETLSFKEHQQLDEMPRWLTDLLGTYTNQRGYDKAQQLLQQILDRKAKEAGGMKKLKHDPAYYAAVVAKQIKGIDARVLARLVSEQTLAEAAEVAFEVEIEDIGTMLVAGANKQEVKQRLQKMFRDARKFSIGKRLMDPQIKMWYRSKAGDKPQVDESRITHAEEDGLREFLRKKKQPVKQSPIQKVLSNIETNRDKRPKDVKLDGGKVVKVTPEVARELMKFVNKKNAEGDKRFDLSKFDVFSKVMKQLNFPITVREELELDEEWNIDLFLEDTEQVEGDDDDALAIELEKIIDAYNEIEDLPDLYPDLDNDGDHDDDDEELRINRDGEEKGVIDDNYKWVNEVLTPAQRFKRSQQMRRLKGKIARARKIALKRPSSPEKLQSRAQRHARNLIRKKFIKGKNYNELSFAEKQAVEKRMQGKGALINRIAMRVKPKLKKLEQERLRNQNTQESRLIEANEYRVGSEMYYETFNEWKKSIDRSDLDSFDRELLESDIGSFAMYEGNHVPLDCPMMEEEKQPELNKPKAGGPKKYYVYVKDPSSGNIKKVSWGDTTGLKIKLNDPEARKSFAARHQCSTKKDKTKPGYWACRMPYYAKQLGLSGGGNFFW